MPRKLISLVTALLFLLQSTLALAVPHRYADTRVSSYCDCEFERNPVAGISIAAARNLELSSLQTRRTSVGSKLAGNNINLQAKDKLTLQAAQLSADETLSIETDELKLASTQNYQQRSVQRSGKSTFMQEQSGEGNTDSDTQYTRLTYAKLNLKANAIQAEGAAGDLSALAEKMSQRPGMAWLNEIKNHPQIDWKKVEEIHDSWDYSSQGLTAEAAMVVSVAVALSTSGLGAGYIGASGTTLLGGAANAAFSTLASQAAVSLANNQGNVFDTLDELSTSKTLETVIKAGISGGVATELGAFTSDWGKAPIPEGAHQGMKVVDWSGRLGAVASKTIIGGGMNRALWGMDKEDAFRNALVSTLANEIYQDTVGRKPDARPGVFRGEGSTYEPLSSDAPPMVKDPVTGEWREANNFGNNRLPVTGESCLFCQGQAGSNFFNRYLPAASPISTFHDALMTPLERNGYDWLNYPTMLPAAGIAIPATLDQYGLGFIPYITNERQDEDR